MLSSFHDHKGMFLLSLIFVLAPFYYHHNYGGVGLGIPFNLSVWLFTLIFLWHGCLKVIRAGEILIPDNFYLLLQLLPVLILAVFISGSVDHLVWAQRLIFISLGVLFALVVFNYKFTPEQRDNLLLIVVISGGLHATVAIVQQLFNQHLGKDFFSLAEISALTSTFQQINNHASYQVTGLLLCAYLILKDSRLKSTLILVCLPIIAASSSFIIVASHSRLAIILTVIGMTLFFVLRYRVITQRRKIFCYFLLMSVLGAFIGYSSLESKPLSAQELVHKTFDFNHRKQIYEISIDLIKASPVLGYGVGAFPSQWQEKKSLHTLQGRELTDHEQLISHPHNELLLWQIEAGLLASLGLMIFCVGVFVLLWQGERWLLIPLMPIAAHNLVELPFHTSAVHWLVLLLLLALGINTQSQAFFSFNISKTATKQFFVHFVFVIFVTSVLHALVVSRGMYTNNLSAINAAMKNPLLISQAENFFYTKLFVIAEQNQHQPSYRAYLEWAEVEIKLNPNPVLFQHIIRSYFQIGMKTQACSMNAKAVSIYPENRQFQYQQRKCKK